MLVDKLRSWWPTIVLIVGAIWTAVGSQVVAVVSSYPKASSIIGIAIAILTHLLPSPAVAPTSGGTSGGIGAQTASRYSMVFALILAGSFLVACNKAEAVNVALSVADDTVQLAIVDIPPLEAAGVISAPDATAATGWLKGGDVLIVAAKGCVTASGGKLAVIQGCVNAVGVGLESPTELAYLRVVSTKSEGKVKLYVIAATLAVNAVADIAGSLKITAPTVGSGTAPAPTTAELREFAKPLPQSVYLDRALGAYGN